MYIPSISHTLPNSKHDVFAYSSPSAKKGPLSTSASNMRKLEKEKTVLCKNFESKKWCEYGAKCKFAHGTKELRIETYTTATMWGLCLETYRSRPCLDFVSTGKW